MTPVPDDSALLHAGVYDPAKAREYYLRTRHLKGRRSGVVDTPSGNGRPQGVASGGHMRPSRRAELEAQKAALEKRLDRLKSVLADLVKAAKARSGVPEPDKNQTPEEQAKEKAAQNERDKNSKPLTEKQKRDKREASRKQYQKEKGMSLTKNVEQLTQQIHEIRAKIEQAIEDARKQAARSNPQTASKGR